MKKIEALAGTVTLKSIRCPITCRFFMLARMDPRLSPSSMLIRDDRPKTPPAVEMMLSAAVDIFAAASWSIWHGSVTRTSLSNAIRWPF